VLEAITFRPLAAGEPPDLIGLSGNPFDDLRALGDIQLIVRGGHRFR
jgi:hypothetical protein